MMLAFLQEPGGGGGGNGGGDSSRSARGVPGAPVVALMLAVIVLLWGGFLWLAATRMEGLHALTFESRYPGEARVLELPFGGERWQVAFREAHAPQSAASRDEWSAAHAGAAWLASGFHSGRALRRSEDGGATYLVQLRARDASGDDLQRAALRGHLVDVPFEGQHETHLHLDEQGRLLLSTGRAALPELGLFGWDSQPATARAAHVDRTALPPPPSPADPLLPDTSTMTFREDG